MRCVCELLRKELEEALVLTQKPTHAGAACGCISVGAVTLKTFQACSVSVVETVWTITHDMYKGQSTQSVLKLW